MTRKYRITRRGWFGYEKSCKTDTDCVRKTVDSCYLSHAIHLPPFAKKIPKPAILCENFPKTPPTTLDGGNNMVLTYWIGDELLPFACEIRQVAAEFCENLARSRSLQVS